MRFPTQRCRSFFFFPNESNFCAPRNFARLTLCDIVLLSQGAEESHTNVGVPRAASVPKPKLGGRGVLEAARGSTSREGYELVPQGVGTDDGISALEVACEVESSTAVNTSFSGGGRR